MQTPPVHPRAIDRALPFFRNAAAFWNAYCAVADSLGRGQDYSLLAPLFVNLSFAGELLLKVLLIVETGHSVRGHDLFKLFNQLPKPVQRSIEDRFSQAASASQMHGMLGSIRPTLTPNFRASLKEAARTFESWRYPGEAELNAPGPLQLIVEAFKDHLIEKHPALLGELEFPLSATGLKITAFVGGS